MGALVSPTRILTGQGFSAFYQGDLYRGTYPLGESAAEIPYSYEVVPQNDVAIAVQESPSASQTAPFIEQRSGRDEANRLMYMKLLDQSAATADTSVALAVFPVRGENPTVAGTLKAIPIKGGCAFLIATTATSAITVNVGRLLPEDAVVAKFCEFDDIGNESDVWVARTNGDEDGYLTISKTNAQNFPASAVLNLVVLVLYGTKGSKMASLNGFFGPKDSNGTGTIPSGAASATLTGLKYIDTDCVVIVTMTSGADTLLKMGLCEEKASRTMSGADDSGGSVLISTADGSNASADVTFEYVILHN